MNTIFRSTKLAAMLVAAAMITACGQDYSTGTRAGVVTKLSRKGIFCKTWEGELAMLSVRGVSRDDGTATMSNAFPFTAADDAVASELQGAMEAGLPVVLHYSQWAIRPPCQTSTGYMVTRVEVPGRAEINGGVEYR